MMSRETVGALTAVAAVSALLICYAPPAPAQESRSEPSPSTRVDGGMRERLSRQVAPNPSTP